ncbi:MAG: hypothetical protein EAZ89_06060, partial [Bacteroidetes bacterium]
MNIRLCVLLMLMLPALLPAQDSLKRTPLQVGLGFSAFSYVGDLSDPGLGYQRVYPGGEISLQPGNQKALRVQFHAGFGKFADQYDGELPAAPVGVTPPTFVQTQVIHGDLRLSYRLFPRAILQPYVSAGAGLLFFSPRDQNNRRLLAVSSSRPEGETYNTAIPQLPLAAGLQGRITPQVSLSLDYTYRFIPSDYLDNTGQTG